jgi:creatinine amidohydrolase
MPLIGYWVDQPATTFRTIDGNNTIAILPLGASEQHGPHLPLATDRDLVDEVIRRSLPLLHGPGSVLVLPTLAICKSNEHQAFPGTLSLSAETLIRVIMEIGACVARTGIRRLLFFNGHGGNMAVMEICIRDLRAQHQFITAMSSWYLICDAEQSLSAHERSHGIHAGENETSAMLACRPALVHMEHAQQFHSATEDWQNQYTYLGLGNRPARPGWLIEDLNPAGACGNAAAATAELGERLLQNAATNLAQLIEEFGRFGKE